jgi:hypothetical protein
MSKIVGAEKIRRTCQVRGREGEGRVGLLRKQFNVSKVLWANGQEEDIETSLIFDERILPKPKESDGQPAETKIHPANKPERRICFLVGHSDEERFHLLRRGNEVSKILRVGEEGAGRWIPSDQIRDEHTVPAQMKPRAPGLKPIRVCTLAMDENPGQVYAIVRKTSKGARLVPIFNDDYGKFVSDLSQIVDERVYPEPRRRKKRSADGVEQGQSDNGEPVAAEFPDESQAEVPVEPAPPVQHVAPVQHPVQQPVQHTPVQQPVQHPAQHAPVQPQRPVAPAAAGQPQRTMPQQPVRPAPVQPGAPRPGQPMGGQVRPVPQARPIGQR